MTREETRKLLPLLQAFANGETLQYRQVGFPNSEWTDSNSEDIDFFQNNWEYRVKPIERENDVEKYVVLTNDDNLVIEKGKFKDKKKADELFNDLINCRDNTYNGVSIIEYSDDFTNHRCIKHYSWN